MTTQKQLLEEFKKKFGVRVVVGGERYDMDVAYNIADEEKAAEYIESFLSAELSIYSPNALKGSRISSIVLCKNLASWGKKVSGLADLRWTGFTWFLGNQFFVDVERPFDAFTRKVIHHELYHLIDSADDFNGLYDNNWKKLNKPEFTYKDDLLVNQTAEQKPARGFISTYAMQAVEEDKAEVFSHMIVDYNGFEKATKGDVILRRKMDRMKELMKAFCDHFDETFWKERMKASVHLERY